MPDEQFQYESIGVIRTPFESPDGMPIQPTGADDAVGTVEVKESYADGLQDLYGFTHCILLYHFTHLVTPYPCRLNRFLMTKKEESLPRGHHSVRIRLDFLLSKSSPLQITK